MRESFIFYRSFFEAIKDLNKTDQQELLCAICDYSLNGNEPDLFGICDTLWKLIKPQLEANNKRYLDGAKGGRPKKKTSGYEEEKTSGYEIKKPNKNENDNENDNENVNKNKNDNENAAVKKTTTNKFFKPSIQQIKTYCCERKNTIQAESFFYYYESKGWMIGKNKMKDWKAAVRTWEKRDSLVAEPKASIGGMF